MDKTLNLPLQLDDGRMLLIRSGQGQIMVCRQKTGEPLLEGDLARTIPGGDGRKAAMRVIKRTKKDITFEILGSCDGDRWDLGWLYHEVIALFRRILYWIWRPKRLR